MPDIERQTAARPDLGALLDDLATEQADLDGLLGGLDEASWDRPTPADGWTVRDQVGHLAFFDEMAALAASDAAAMEREAAAAAGDPSYMDRHLDRGRAMRPAELLAWWRASRRQAAATIAGLPAPTRLPWYGPPMGLASFVTARLMETWAHGQDVADALGVERVPTARLRHVADLGVRTRPFSYRVRGLVQPDVPVRVTLAGPGGERWEWGDDAAADRVEGDALDFCLVATQRRHVADTRLDVAGPAAREWLSIAQAYAGGPGPGRPPGRVAGRAAP